MCCFAPCGCSCARTEVTRRVSQRRLVHGPVCNHVNQQLHVALPRTSRCSRPWGSRSRTFPWVTMGTSATWRHHCAAQGGPEPGAVVAAAAVTAVTAPGSTASVPPSACVVPPWDSGCGHVLCDVRFLHSLTFTLAEPPRIHFGPAECSVGALEQVTAATLPRTRRAGRCAPEAAPAEPWTGSAGSGRSSSTAQRPLPAQAPAQMLAWDARRAMSEDGNPKFGRAAA